MYVCRHRNTFWIKPNSHGSMVTFPKYISIINFDMVSSYRTMDRGPIKKHPESMKLHETIKK